MLKFQVFENGRTPADWPLTNAHLLGADDIGVKGMVEFRDGMIVCDKSAVGPAALALQVEIEGAGDLMLQTCLLPERERPYLLTLELARHRTMRCISKQEDWAMFDLGDDHPAIISFQRARGLFVEALCAADDPPEADRIARRALAAAIDASEEIALTHADALLNRRRQSGQLSRNILGCGVRLNHSQPKRIAPVVLEHFDYLRLPTPWRELEPEEQEYDWKRLDAWTDWANKRRMPVVAGPLISFSPDVVPDWLYIWEHDYDTVRDLLYEHIERVATRYRNAVSLWNVVSGVHVNDHFQFNFEQLMDLTRMAVMLVKKIHPAGRTLIEITHPFGEYYAHNTRSIPPLMYGEMLLQAGIPFDGFGLKLPMGDGAAGRCTRDLMQLSALLDRFSGLGKPVHITGAAVPSRPVASANSNPGGAVGESSPSRAGYWHEPWSPEVQGRWLREFYEVALSKPFVESVSWTELADEGAGLPNGGLLGEDFQPKAALHRHAELRDHLRDGL